MRHEDLEDVFRLSADQYQLHKEIGQGSVLEMVDWLRNIQYVCMIRILPSQKA